MEMKKCPNCQSNIPMTADRCPLCSFDLSKEYNDYSGVHQGKLNQALKPNERANATVPEKTVISGKGKYSLAGIICFGVAALFLIMGGFWILDFAMMKKDFPEIGGFGFLPIAIPMAVVGLIVLIIGIILSKSQITVTNKRITGKLPFGRNIDLPLDTVYYVTAKKMNTVAVQTGFKTISFQGVSNYQQITSEACKLLNEMKK